LSAGDYSPKKDRENREIRLDLIRKAHNERKEDEMRTDRIFGRLLRSDL
jgi:hypothetical protein